MPPLPAPLVDARSYVPDAVLDVRYASRNNFLGRALYPFPAVYLRRETAENLRVAAQDLGARDLRMILFDGYRPLSAQKTLWQSRPDSRFVADPARGSFHNRGAAVDLSLARKDGQPMEMPSDYDQTESSPPSREAVENARVLRCAMEASGFSALAEEWWHFHDPRAEKWPILDLSFTDVREAVKGL